MLVPFAWGAVAGHQTPDGRPPYLEPAGVRSAIVDFDGPKTLAKVVVWHHGVEHTQAAPFLDYWDVSAWKPITFTRSYGKASETGQNSGSATSDEYSFAPVTGSKIRYSFDNSGSYINGTFNVHGWIYEVEVY